MAEIQLKNITDFFTVTSGDYHATKDLDPGTVPLISCGDGNNGLIGYYEVPAAKIYGRGITAAYNGSWPLTAKFHPYPFAAKDDVAVLIPKTALRDQTLLYVAAVLNRMTWRYSYGRKCFKEKLMNLRIPVPVLKSRGKESIDEKAIVRWFPTDFRKFLPKQNPRRLTTIPRLKWTRFKIVKLFDIDRGDFHSIDKLDPGLFTTVSRSTDDNGVVGYFDKPRNAALYPRGSITVSTVAGDAFVQLDDFIATDNVIICSPKKPLRLSTIIFVAFVLNHQKWRYSYGRQCYKTKFARTEIFLPTKAEGRLDEDVILSIVEAGSYWPQIKAAVSDARPIAAQRTLKGNTKADSVRQTEFDINGF